MCFFCFYFFPCGDIPRGLYHRIERSSGSTDIFSPCAIRLLTFPLITIASINGHGEFLPAAFVLAFVVGVVTELHPLSPSRPAFAGGFLLALCCDYRLMTDGKAWCCMNEVGPETSLVHAQTSPPTQTYASPFPPPPSPTQIDFGAPFPPFFASLLKHKLGSYPNVLREVSLGKRFTATDLQAAGLVDEIVPALGLRTRGVEFGNKIGLKSAQGPWGLIKVRRGRSCRRRPLVSDRLVIPLEQEELYHDCIVAANRTEGPGLPEESAQRFLDRVGSKYATGKTVVESKL